MKENHLIFRAFLFKVSPNVEERHYNRNDALYMLGQDAEYTIPHVFSSVRKYVDARDSYKNRLYEAIIAKSDEIEFVFVKQGKTTMELKMYIPETVTMEMILMDIPIDIRNGYIVLKHELFK